ncbi:peptidylprolyl isomerase [Ilumatobacter nonamiensis]|uniref:peptidylprolyl isomerase n=1 Tax=Ilumatobacter nonamiensis TaxID=467093 RepID=UPI0019D327D7|nr:peptidylprolyl isomerase [Ilumatobacter nonamiensis]
MTAPPEESAPVDDIEESETPAASAEDCPPVDGTDTVTQQFDAEPPFCLDPDTTYSAVLTTSSGDVTIEFDQDAAPLAVNSFVFLARNNYFDDTICHRVVADFVVQCGDPTGTGTGGPGYLFDDELPAPGSYEVGSVAMAHIPQPDTNGSQFFIISGPSGVALPPEYSLFGQVPDESLPVVDAMNALAPTDGSQVPTEEIRILDVEIIES